MSYAFKNTAYCIEYFYAKPGCREKLIVALLKLVAPSRAEKGCLQYDLLLDNKNPDLIILLVKFIDQESMRIHEKSQHVQDFSLNELKQYCEKFTWNYAKETKKENLDP